MFFINPADLSLRSTYPTQFAIDGLRRLSPSYTDDRWKSENRARQDFTKMPEYPVGSKTPRTAY
jgi:hypothetical protein